MDALDIEPHPLSIETASGTGAAWDIGLQRTCLRLRLSVSALNATSLAIVVQTAPAIAGPWEQIGTLPVVTAAVTRPDVILLGARQFVRCAWTLTGASATFRVQGQAHSLLATPDDVASYAFPARVSDALDPLIAAVACLAATEETATYLAGRFTFPLLSWGLDITMHVAKMAGYLIMARRGFQPGGSDDLIVKGRDDAISYFRMISKNELYPTSIVDSDVVNVGVTDAYIVSLPGSQWDAFGGSFADPVFGDPLTRG